MQGIQYAAASLDFITDASEYWIARWSLSSGSPKARPGGGRRRQEVWRVRICQTQLHDPAARCARVVHEFFAQEKEGVGNAGCPLHPQPVCKR
jgi:hypothetical protein